MLDAIKLLIKNLPPEQYEELCKEMATEDVVIRSVAEQIIHGRDNDGSGGHDDYYAEPMPPLTAARVYVMKRASQTAALAMDNIVADAKTLRAENAELRVKLKQQDVKIQNAIEICNERSDLSIIKRILSNLC